MARWHAIPLSRIKARKIDWLLEGFIPLGVCTALGGDGGVGKTMAMLDIVACLTTGSPMPTFGEQAAPAKPLEGSAIILCKEDDPGRVTRPRLEAAGADVNKTYIVTLSEVLRGQSPETVGDFDNGFGELERLIQYVGDVRLILIDPITSFVGSRGMYADNKIREMLDPLNQIAARYNLAVINVSHTSKDKQRKGNQRLLGGGAFVNAQRSVIYVAQPDKSSGRRLLMLGKKNYWPTFVSVEFSIENKKGKPSVTWGGDFVDVDFEEVLAGGKRFRTKTDEAALLLRRLLADGPKGAVEVKEEAVTEGVSLATLRLAKAAAGIRSVKRSDGSWWWSLQER